MNNKIENNTNEKLEKEMELSFQTNEYIELPEIIKITLKDDYKNKIEQVRKAIANSEIEIDSVNIKSHEIFDADYSEFEEANFRVGYECVNVFPDGSWYLNIQNKYDSTLQAEYSIK